MTQICEDGYAGENDPDTVSFEEQADACAEYIGMRITDKYGLTVSDEMETDISMWIQDHFNADEI